MSKSEWKRRKQKIKRIKQITILAGLAVIAILVLVFVIKLLTHLVTGNNGIIKEAGDIKIEKKLLTVDNNTRSEQELEKVKGIVIHNTGEPETTANSMWEYYESLADTGTTSESVHFLVDLDGEIIQCIPCNEIAFHAMGRNSDTIGIMYCYSNDSGIMTGDTYESMVELVAELIKEYDLSISDVQLHYDITGRLCPQYYVQNETEWQNFLSDVSLKLK
jgi:N-acetylmuramoyl-L-alanine amidase CwlA